MSLLDLFCDYIWVFLCDLLKNIFNAFNVFLRCSWPWLGLLVSLQRNWTLPYVSTLLIVSYLLIIVCFPSPPCNGHFYSCCNVMHIALFNSCKSSRIMYESMTLKIWIINLNYKFIYIILVFQHFCYYSLLNLPS